MWWSASWSAPRKPRSGRPWSSRAPHHEVAQNAGHDRLRPPGLAVRWTPRRVLLPSVRLDGPSLGIDGDWPPQRPRLGVGEGTGSYGLRDLTNLHSATRGNSHAAKSSAKHSPQLTDLD